MCSLEPVCCEMREFGCGVVVPRKDLATHMRESELQHLTGMAVLNLQLTRQLQEDMAEKDKMITELQQQMAAQRQLQNDMKKEIDEQKKLEGKEQTVVRKEMAEQREMMKKDMTKMKEKIQKQGWRQDLKTGGGLTLHWMPRIKSSVYLILCT